MPRRFGAIVNGQQLADGLIKAKSVSAFFLEQRNKLDWRAVAALKTEVDRLVGCDLNSATSLADRIRELAALVNDPRSDAFANASRARVLDNLGRHSEANKLYERSARAMRLAGLVKEAAMIQKQQLHALMNLGRYQEALRTASAARRVLSQTEPVQLAQLEANVGNVYYRLDRYKQALAHYDRAREILLTHGDATMLAVVDFSRSNVFADIDRPDEALRLLEDAAAQFERAGRFLQAGQARFHIAQFTRGFELREQLLHAGQTVGGIHF